LETALLLAQIVTSGSIAGWLTLGLRDNLLHPELNGFYTREVLEMTRLRDQYPDEFQRVAHRAITKRATQTLAFKAVVLAECVICLILWIGTIALVLAAISAVPTDTARALAIVGATGFVGIWAGFLIVGNHFCYWMCHEGAQNTHYQMTLWGLAVLILLCQT
jgi:predicted small integral membrane protein